MTLSQLVATCPCGGRVATVNMYVSDQKALLVTGMCITCNEQIKTAWPLTELYKRCPPPETSPLRTPQAETKRRPVKPPLQLPPGDDASFLHSMGISDELPQA